jgi:hypothetical protein
MINTVSRRVQPIQALPSDGGNEFGFRMPTESKSRRAERIRKLQVRVEAIRVNAERVRTVRRTPTSVAVRTAPGKTDFIAGVRFAPEITLTIAGCVALLFIPIDWISGLSDLQMLVAIGIVICALAMFVITGATLWNSFRDGRD